LNNICLNAAVRTSDTVGIKLLIPRHQFVNNSLSDQQEDKYYTNHNRLPS